MGCCDGGGSSTTTYEAQDPEAARRMAAVAERGQEMTEDQWNYAKEISQPYTTDLFKANRALIPGEQAYTQANTAAQTALVGDREAATRAGLQESARDIEQGQAVKDKLREQQLHELDISQPAADKFYQEAIDGVNVGERMGLAQGDVVMSAAGQKAAAIADARARGIDVNSPAFLAMLKDIDQGTIDSIAGARTTARLGAEGENFQRLGTAMNVRGRASGLPGTGDMSGVTSGASQLGVANGQLQKYNLTDPMQTVNSLYGTTVAANTPGMQMNKVGETSDDGGAGAGAFLGGAAKLGISAYSAGMFSSRRYKKNITPDGDMEAGVQPVTFEYTEEAQRDKGLPCGVQKGYIAEEVAEVFPEAVIFDELGRPDMVNYAMLAEKMAAVA